MSGTPMALDLTRPLTAKEAKAFEARKRRLLGSFGKSAAQATSRFNAALGAPGHMAEGLRIRAAFSCLASPIAEGDVSDRRAPGLELRPAATRIVTSQGLALRLYLTIIAAAQVATKPGKAYSNKLPIVGTGHPLGWDDIVATGAIPSGRGATYSSVRDKKGRSIRTGLDNLERAAWSSWSALRESAGATMTSSF